MPDIIYNTIGTGYNLTRRADPYLVGRLLHFLQPEGDGLYLDIGCGTGNYTIALAEKGVNLYGVEPSEKMLSIARQRSGEVHWLTGSVENIPVKENTIDGAIATLTIHHWTNLNRAFSELSRILRDTATIVLFTSEPEQMEQYWLNHYFPDMLAASVSQMPSLSSITKAAAEAGLEVVTLEKYFVKDDLQDHFLYVGKNKPELYFDGQVRSGISSFASLANRQEVEQGLHRLKLDLDNNSFEAVKRRYKNDKGDYLFVVLKKKSNTDFT